MSNLRINTRSIVDSLMPTAFIDNIILESNGDVIKERNPHISVVRDASDSLRGIRLERETFLSVKVDILLKDVLESNIASSWLEQHNVFNFLRVAVLVSTNKAVTDSILENQRLITRAVFSRNGGPLASRIVSLMDPSVGTVQFCQDNIRVNVFDLGDRELNTESEIEQLSDGTRIRNIGIRAHFNDINKKNPYTLDVVAFTYLDTDALEAYFSAATSSNLDFGNTESLTFSTSRTTSHSVIKNGEVSKSSFIYKEMDGTVWAGPVHQMPDGTWMAGSYHGQLRERLLERIVLSDITIQDFRNVVDLEKNIQNLVDFRSQAYNSFDRIFRERVASNLPNIENNKYFSDLYLSRSIGDNATMFFSFDYKTFLKNSCRFPKLIDNRPGLLKSNFHISNIKIIRRRIKKPPKFKNSEIGFEVDSRDIQPFEENQIERVVIEAMEVEGTVPTTRGLRLGNSIREVNFHSGNFENKIRSFSVKDKTISSVSDGFYQYGVEIQVRDSLADYLMQKVAELSNARKDLYNYFIDAVRPFGAKEDSSLRGNPHIQPSIEGNRFLTNSKSSYNPNTNRFTADFVDKMNRIYADRGNEKPWIVMTTKISEVLALLTSNDGFSRSDTARKIWKLCNPRTGSPDGIQIVLKVVDDIIARIENSIGANPSTVTEDSTNFISNNRLSSGGRGLSSGGVDKNTYTIKYYFKNSIFDSNMIKKTGFHFLPSTGQDTRPFLSDDLVGVTTISADQFFNRHSDEVLKYFRDPSRLPVSYDGDGDLNQLIPLLSNVETSKYGFLSTSMIETDGRRFFLDGSTIRGNIAVLASNILNLKSPPNEPMRNPAKVKTFELSTLESENNRVIMDNLVEVLADKSCTIEPTSSEQGAENEDIALDVDFSRILGGTSIAPGQLRENLERVYNQAHINIHTTENGNESDLGPLFMKLILNVALEQENLFSMEDETQINLDPKDIKKFDLNRANHVLRVVRERRTTRTLGGSTLQGSYSDFVPQLPLQIKSLFLESHSSSRDLVRKLIKDEHNDPMVTNTDLLEDPVRMIKFFLVYMSIMRIEVLESYYGSTGATGEIDGIGAPKWTPLSNFIINSSTLSGYEMICRATPYINYEIGVQPIKGLNLPLYDQYFIIKPNESRVRAPGAENLPGEEPLYGNENETNIANISQDLQDLEQEFSSLGREYATNRTPQRREGTSTQSTSPAASSVTVNRTTTFNNSY